MRERGVGRAEDYTQAFLGMAYLLAVTGLTIAWGVWGYGAALLLCGAAHLGLRRLGTRRAAREAEWEARVAAAITRGRARD